MGKRNKKNRSNVVNMFSDDEDNNNNNLNNNDDNVNMDEETDYFIESNKYDALDIDCDDFVPVKKYNKIIKQQPKINKNITNVINQINEKTIFSKALELDKNEDYLNAIKYYKESIENDNDDKIKIKSIFNLALIYENILNDKTNAEYYYRMATDMDYNDAYCNLALLLMENKKFSDSVYFFKKAIKGGDFDIIESFIECLCLMNNNKEAYELLEKYKKFVNTNKEIKKLFAKSVSLPFD
jgi:tetratricopeptide (TPR) repeat protein